MKILFVCKHNRFRSKVAESIFLALNKNNGIEVESAGLQLDELRPYIEKNVIQIMKEKGYEIKGKPRKMSTELIKDFDLIVIVADNVKKELFSGFKGKIIKWDIKDCNANEVERIKKIVDEIEVEVKCLIKQLNKKV